VIDANCVYSLSNIDHLLDLIQKLAVLGDYRRIIYYLSVVCATLTPTISLRRDVIVIKVKFKAMISWETESSISSSVCFPPNVCVASGTLISKFLSLLCFLHRETRYSMLPLVLQAKRSLTAEDRKNALAEQYARMFGCPEMRHPVNYVEKNWAEEEYSGGCYVSHFAPGILTSFGDVIRQPSGRVFYAGTETATYWSGYMEGAIQAGERAAREVLHAVGRIDESEIWKDEEMLPDWPELPVELSTFQRCLPSVPTAVVGFCSIATALVAWLIQHYCYV